MNETIVTDGQDFHLRNWVMYQIIWKDEQIPNLYPFSTPLKNEGLTVFFENEVIRSLVPLATTDKIGVCSHALRQKIGRGIPLREPFTEKSLDREFDVLSLDRKSPEERMLFRLNDWHPGSRAVLDLIFAKLGLNPPVEPKNPIYRNHFVAKRSIYQDYVGSFLIPAMDLMSSDPELIKLLNVDSGYYKLKPPYGEFAQRVKKYLGTDFVSLHTFILERCFSCWINDKPIKVSYL